MIDMPQASLTIVGTPEELAEFLRPRPATPSEAAGDDFRRYLREGKSLNAIKIVRDVLGLGLLDAKNLVDKIKDKDKAPEAEA